MLPGRLNITQARRLLPSLIHELELHPDRVFMILARHRLVAELKAPSRAAKRGLAADRLYALATRRPAKGKGVLRVSEDTDSVVYGAGRPARRRAGK